uniref:Putative TPR repeat-containing protein n=1 Tax=uncultured prokaryote EC6 TaxID=672204 RepID=D3W8K4_9ZZZZ|nr:putative TPR repeat-containing protein [uncultured prokaryote EC6]
MNPSGCRFWGASTAWKRAVAILLGLIPFLRAPAAEPAPQSENGTNWVQGLIQRIQSDPSQRGDAERFVVVFREGSVKVVPSSGTEEDAEEGRILQRLDEFNTGRPGQAIVLRLSEATGLDENTLVTVTRDDRLYQRKGRLYRVSLGPTAGGEISIETPAGVVQPNGTEFHLEVDPATGQTRLWVRDGSVTLTNALGEHPIVPPSHPGPTGRDFSLGVMTTNQPPREEDPPAGVRTFNQIIQWVLYHPAILDPGELSGDLRQDSAMQESLAAYERGNLLLARQKYPPTWDSPPRSPADALYRAALLTGAGRIEEAEQLLAPLVTSTTTAPTSGHTRELAQAFEVLGAAVRNEPLTNRPTPQSATAWMAESYYLQSRSDLRDNIALALAAAEKATAARPDFSFAWGRVAELQFSRGDRKAARAAIEQARRLGPDNPQLLALDGYVHAAAGRISEARRAFEEAVLKDGRLGDALLGLGLCLIRQGQKEAGLQFLQMAAAREPQRATLKSYLAKAYELTGNPAAAMDQLRAAERVDPQDPTPRLYSALIKQQENRINEAIADLEKSVEENDNRQLYRSRVLLDQDRAVRGANLAAIYRDAGMADVSVREATRAVSSDYGNSSAHLFLANSYDAFRDPRQITLRYETPWLNELLIAQLLQPVGGGSLSQTVSQQEYSRLFQQDGFGAYSRTEYTSNGDWIESASQFGNFGNTDYSVDVFYESLNGQRPNDDFRGLTVWTKVKQQITPDDSVLLEAVYYDSDGGDNRQLYSPTNALPNLRVQENGPTILAGYHHVWSPENQTLLLTGWVHDDLETSAQRLGSQILLRNKQGDLLPGYGPIFFNNDLQYESALSLFTAELQHIWTLDQDRFTTIVGARYQVGQFDTDSLLNHPKGIPVFPPIKFSGTLATQDLTSDFDRFAAYLYEYWKVQDWLTLVGGVAYDDVSYPINHRYAPISAAEDDQSQVSPKAGFILTPLRDTTLRGSYTRSLGGLSLDQSYRLEPTQVAGFIQSYRSLIPESVVGSVPVPDFETWGLLLDHRFTRTHTYVAVGAERLTSSATQFTGAFDSSFFQPLAPAAVRNELDYEEKSLNATFNQLLGSCWSVGARYRYSVTELEQQFALDAQFGFPHLGSGTTKAKLHSLDGFVLLNLPCGFFSEGQVLWRSQSNEGYADLPGDSFAQVNLFAGYRFLRRRGEIRVGVLNLTDQDYQLNPLSFYAELPRERMFYASLKLEF